MNAYFVNEAFEKAVHDYLASKERKQSVLYNSFLVVVIRLLIIIYNELDIVTPYNLRDEAQLNKNLMKYGYSLTEIKKLYDLLNNYYELDLINQRSNDKKFNKYFVDIQKLLIDMFYKKSTSINVSDNEKKSFFELLYTPVCKNALMISYNYLTAENIYEVALYYSKIFKDNKSSNNEKKELLPFEIYKMFNYDLVKISKLSVNEVKELNKKILNELGINENAMNKDFLLNEKIRLYNEENSKITTGNGYVDILLIMSVITTSLMVIIIFGKIVF